MGDQLATESTAADWVTVRCAGQVGPVAQSLWHVPSNTLDLSLVAAAQLDDVAIRVAHEHRDVAAFAEADRSLADRDIVGLQRRDRRRDRGDPQCDVRVAGEFSGTSIRILAARSPALALNTRLSSRLCSLRLAIPPLG